MENTPEKNNYASISEEIRGMYAWDQAVREAALKNNGVIENPDDEKIDEINTNKLKDIIGKIGWPVISKFGTSVSQMAWLLVQHADHDVTFQKECLKLMKEAIEGEVSKTDIAYLEDRIRVNQKMPQLYGTQFYEVDGVYQLRPIENEENVDKRRKSMGMTSLEEYKNAFMKKYKM